MASLAPLHEVQQQIMAVVEKVSERETSLAAAKQAGDDDEVKHLRDRLVQLDRERVALREKENQLMVIQSGGQRPAKRAFAWHAEEALHFGKAVGWPAASLLTVPPSAWSSDTCDSSIRDRYFHDLLELQAASVSDQGEGLHD